MKWSSITLLSLVLAGCAAPRATKPIPLPMQLSSAKVKSAAAVPSQPFTNGVRFTWHKDRPRPPFPSSLVIVGPHAFSIWYEAKNTPPSFNPVDICHSYWENFVEGATYHFQICTNLVNWHTVADTVGGSPDSWLQLDLQIGPPINYLPISAGNIRMQKAQ